MESKGSKFFSKLLILNAIYYILFFLEFYFLMINDFLTINHNLP